MADSKRATATPSEASSRHELRRPEGMMTGDATLPKKLRRQQRLERQHEHAAALRRTLEDLE